MKVLMITVRADFGGGPEHLFRLVGGLSSKTKVYTAAPEDVPYFIKYSALCGIENMIKIPHREFKVKDLFRLAEFVRKNKIDLIHSHGKGAGIYSRMLHLLTNKPVVHTFHGLHIDKYNTLQAKLYVWLEKFLASFTSRFISVSQGEYKKVLNLKLASKLKTTVIENGVLIPEITVNGNVTQSETLSILTITRFDYAKNTELLFPIAQKLIELKQISSFKFVIVGKGENEDEFRKLIELNGLENYFLFAGTTEDVAKYFLNSFCYISTSRWEGLPLSVMEAMAYGLPVIATDVTGNNDLIEHEQTGLLYNLQNPETAAGFIIRLARDNSHWKSISQNAAKKIKEKYSIKRMAEQTEKLYFSALKRNYIE